MIIKVLLAGREGGQKEGGWGGAKDAGRTGYRNGGHMAREKGKGVEREGGWVQGDKREREASVGKGLAVVICGEPR